MTLPDLHLAMDAVVALVDGELGNGARARANEHVSLCLQCREDVAVQRHAKALTAAAAAPALPDRLFARLMDIPFSAELGSPDVVWAMQGEDVQWRPGSTAAPVPAPVPVAPPAAPPPGALETRQIRPAGAPRPASRRGGLSPIRLRRLRTGLVAGVAGLTVGVLATMTPVAVSASPAVATPSRQVDNRPPVSTSTVMSPLGNPGPQFAGFVSAQH